MKCKEVRKYFAEFLKGSISGEKKEKISAHIESCKSCREEFRQFLILTDVISKASTPESDKHFWERYLREIEDRLSALPEKEKGKIVKKIELPSFLRKPAYAVAAALILTIGIITYQKWFSKEESIYIHSNSLEFFLEEFDNVVSENIFIESFPFDEEDFRFFNNLDNYIKTDVKDE
ncbi:MAG: zf-HC2 domain-containing protein [Candidatus Helarchaeota archaeon]|nr:zf-HC2 domain-containing protein [Candidatus Helarchaeota archaeon]